MGVGDDWSAGCESKRGYESFSAPLAARLEGVLAPAPGSIQEPREVLAFGEEPSLGFRAVPRCELWQRTVI